MKKIITLLLLSIFLISCGPKRMKCYGKRCVNTTAKKEISTSSKSDS
jgi:hypothetical protein